MSEIITSPKNEKLRNVSLLQKKKKARDEQGLFVIEGARIFEDALKSAPERIEQIFISESFSKSSEWLKIGGKRDSEGKPVFAVNRLEDRALTVSDDDMRDRNTTGNSVRDADERIQSCGYTGKTAPPAGEYPGSRQSRNDDQDCRGSGDHGNHHELRYR